MKLAWEEMVRCVYTGPQYGYWFSEESGAGNICCSGVCVCAGSVVLQKLRHVYNPWYVFLLEEGAGSRERC